MDLTRAALTHAATLDVALEPELYKSYWEVLCRLACTSRSSSCHSSGLSGSGELFLGFFAIRTTTHVIHDLKTQIIQFRSQSYLPFRLGSWVLKYT